MIVKSWTGVRAAASPLVFCHGCGQQMPVDAVRDGYLCQAPVERHLNLTGPADVESVTVFGPVTPDDLWEATA